MFFMGKINKIVALKIIAIGLLPSLFLSGCHTNGHYSSKIDVSKYQKAIESREDITKKNALESMALYERLYARNTSDKTIAVKYAKSLRKSGYPKQAITILSPLVNLKTNVDIETLLEYVAAAIEAGEFSKANTALGKILDKKNKKTLPPRVSHYKALLLSAEGKHKDAEKYYRKALDGWNGNPVIVMNNLSLNLAEQGKFKEALEGLKQARDISNNNDLIDGNMALIQELRTKLASKTN